MGQCQCCTISEPIQPTNPKQVWPDTNFGSPNNNNNNKKKVILETNNCTQQHSSVNSDELLDKCTSLTPQSSSTTFKYENDLISSSESITPQNHRQSKRRGSIGSTSVASVGASMIRRNSNAVKQLNGKHVTAEDVLSTVLTSIHSILNKQANENKINQKELLSLILYLQQPRKLIGGMSREKMLKVEARHKLDGLQHQDSAVSSWIQNVMNVHVDDKITSNIELTNINNI
eukprot:383293_1